MIELKEQAGTAMNVRGQLSDSIADPQVTLGALAHADELGRLLWRIKYGQHHGGMHRAALLLAKRVRSSGKFKRSQPARVNKSIKGNRRNVHEELDATDVVDRFARRLLLEWVNDQCVVCNGRSILFGQADLKSPVATVCAKCKGACWFTVELHGPFLARVVVPYLPRTVPRRIYERCDACLGRGVTITRPRQDPTKVCGHCAGSGKEPVSDSDRAQALCVSLEQYHRNWARYFSAMHSILDQVDARVDDVVRQRLRK